MMTSVEQNFYLTLLSWLSCSIPGVPDPGSWMELDLSAVMTPA
jgi:hypothetical protein